MFIPLLIITITTFCGIIIWGGMNYSILYLPASYHDIIYILILSLAINLKERRHSYYKSVCWFVAGLFLVQSGLQIFDIRPPGEIGKYDLYTDNIFNAVYVLAYLVIASVMVYMRKLRWGPSMAYLYCVCILFLAFNALLTVNSVRDNMPNYAFVYDSVYYLSLYAITLSTVGPVNEFISNGVNRFRGLLRSGHYHLQ